MKIFITGINGYLGSCLAEHFANRQHVVLGSMRNPTACVGRLANVQKIVPMTLGGHVDSQVFADCDVVIHAAHDVADTAYAANVDGSKVLFFAARNSGVKHQIFLSSYSARPDAHSQYGKIKFVLESFFSEYGHTIVRPGLVIGDGGLFGRNMALMLKTPVVPLFDRGRDPVPVLAIVDFLAAMESLLSRPPGGAYNLFNPRLVPLRELVQTLQRKAGRRAVIVNIPTGLAIWFLTLTQNLHIKLPVNVENLKGARLNRDAFHKSSLTTLVPANLSLESMLENALASRKKTTA